MRVNRQGLKHPQSGLVAVFAWSKSSSQIETKEFLQVHRHALLLQTLIIGSFCAEIFIRRKYREIEDPRQILKIIFISGRKNRNEQFFRKRFQCKCTRQAEFIKMISRSCPLNENLNVDISSFHESSELVSGLNFRSALLSFEILNSVFRNQYFMANYQNSVEIYFHINLNYILMDCITFAIPPILIFILSEILSLNEFENESR